jgi:predicted O-methyltransferase YrrM
MNPVDPAIEGYLEALTREDEEPVLLEMEEHARSNDFPIVGRLCGRFLEVMARSIGAKRVFEMGSGFGYSAYWFAKATGSEGEIHLSDGDPKNETKAMDYLGRAGVTDVIDYHVGDAFEAFAATPGEFDVVYCDIDKHGYPRAWELAKERIRIGGLYMCDNMLWSGRVIGPGDEADDRPHWTAAIDETNRAIAADDAWRSFILPTRDGVVAALRLK